MESLDLATRMHARWLLAFAIALAANAQAETVGLSLPGQPAIEATTAALMLRQAQAGPSAVHPEHELESPDRRSLPQDDGSTELSQWPPGDGRATAIAPPAPAALTTSLAFDGANLGDTGAFPPDSMGAVGPTQFVAFVNGRLRTFSKTGSADGVLNINPDVFFRQRDDAGCRLGRSQLHHRSAGPLRPLHGALVPEHHRRAVHERELHDHRSQSPPDGGQRCRQQWHDQRRHGLDVLLLCRRCRRQFSRLSIARHRRQCAVHRRQHVQRQRLHTSGTQRLCRAASPRYSAPGPIVVHAFANLAVGSGSGPYSPRGVDNLDPSATEGYFIGVDNAVFSRLVLRRVSNPGTSSPSISSNINADRQRRRPRPIRSNMPATPAAATATSIRSMTACSQR